MKRLLPLLPLSSLAAILAACATTPTPPPPPLPPSADVYRPADYAWSARSEEHTSELQSH